MVRRVPVEDTRLCTDGPGLSRPCWTDFQRIPGKESVFIDGVNDAWINTVLAFSSAAEALGGSSDTRNFANWRHGLKLRNFGPVERIGKCTTIDVLKWSGDCEENKQGLGQKECMHREMGSNRIGYGIFQDISGEDLCDMQAEENRGTKTLYMYHTYISKEAVVISSAARSGRCDVHEAVSTLVTYVLLAPD